MSKDQANVMKLIDGNTPRDREIILGRIRAGALWIGNWNGEAFVARTRPNSVEPADIYGEPTHWAELPDLPTPSPQ